MFVDGDGVIVVVASDGAAQAAPAAAVAPQLLVLSWVNDEKKQARLPEATSNQWKDHLVHGEAFMAFVRQHKLGPDALEKRPGSALPSQTKKIKVEQSVEHLEGAMTLDELASIDTVTHEMPLNNVASDWSAKVPFTSDHRPTSTTVMRTGS